MKHVSIKRIPGGWVEIRQEGRETVVTVDYETFVNETGIHLDTPFGATFTTNFDLERLCRIKTSHP